MNDKEGWRLDKPKTTIRNETMRLVGSFINIKIDESIDGGR